MYKSMSTIPKLKSQQGAVLVVCLVILLVMTLLGVSNMQSTAVQYKMAKNNQDRQVAFQVAETALTKVERLLQENGHDTDELQACSAGDASCYDSQCGGGKCFIGSYPSGGAISDCSLTPVISVDNYWSRSDLDVWNDAAKHATVSIDSSTKFPDPKYIVEFLCYIDKDSDVATDCSTNPATDCAALYRITTLATSEDAKGRVMLQSTFKVVNS